MLTSPVLPFPSEPGKSTAEGNEDASPREMKSQKSLAIAVTCSKPLRPIHNSSVVIPERINCSSALFTGKCFTEKCENCAMTSFDLEDID